MDAYLQAKILESLTTQSWGELAGWSLVFVFLWVEVRGLKKEFKGAREELHTMNRHFSKSLADGEKRFETLEAKAEKYDKRMTLIETFLRKETQI